MKIIQTDRLTIKPFSESDKADMLALLYDEEIKKTYMIPDFESYKAAEKLFYAFMRLSNSSDRFVGGVYLDNKLIGFLNDTEMSGKSVLSFTVTSSSVFNTSAILSADAEHFVYIVNIDLS